jgi:hypothetical protein
VLRPCIVTLTDLRGIRHVAEVSADSVFEAASLAVQAFRQSQFVEEVGPATRLEIEVRSATTRHVVTVGQVLRWTEGAATSPAERLRRDRLRAMLGASGQQAREQR